MAYLESAIVIYLRLLYYPDGFQFPLVEIPVAVAIIEIGREAATLVMLWFVARMAAGNFKEQFALFIYSFGVWDIFYYVWLKILLNWPGSLLEWDILFLIPAPWIGPWLAPAIVSAAFISAAVIIILYPRHFGKYILNKMEWAGEIACAVLILFTFFYQTGNVLQSGMPDYYPWWIFLLAMSFGLAIFVRRFFLGNKG